MKKKYIKIVSAVLSAAIVFSCISAGFVYAKTNSKQPKDGEEEKISASNSELQEALLKDETVYVLTDSDGSVKDIIVSDWIKNTAGASLVTDKSDLTDIENIKGEESYTMDENNMRVWDAKEKDIYYKGNIKKELPVKLSVSYKLNGNSITSEDLAGKSGNVAIRFNYKNNQYKTVKINGKEEKINVPFVMLSGMIFDNKVFSNVNITNGKLINDGDRTIAAGIAFPGLKENLNINSAELDIPDYVEITADVKNFSMENTVTIATNEIFSKIDCENIDSVDDLSNSLNKLTTAVNQLVDGSSKLYDGMCVLLDKSNELISGINQLAAGAKQLQQGANSLDSGAAVLDNGQKQLSDGLNALASNNSALNNGSKEIFDSLLNMAYKQLTAEGLTVPKLTKDNYLSVLNNISTSLNKENVEKTAEQQALQTVTKQVNDNKPAIELAVKEKVKEKITAEVKKAVQNNVESNVLSAMGMTKESYNAGIANGLISKEQQKQVSDLIDAQMKSEPIKNLIDTNITAQMNSDNVKSTIKSETEKQIKLLIEQNMNSDNVKSQISAAVNKASLGKKKIAELTEQLNNYNKFYNGLNRYTNGVADSEKASKQLSQGASKLKAGTAEIKAGIDVLCSGIFEIKKESPALIDGVTQLSKGSMQLSNGLKEFNEKGIKTLVNTFNGDIKDLFLRIKATVDVSKDYKSFSGINENMDGQIKFVYRTDSIKNAN